ncbi:MAG TPA: zinc-dependent alcohol dehydrogenase family protein [Acidobacteriaceae bacterium]|nr:zinc-dependent alcohol dehydrogenase family protein [Acidobacteriaceae bacterium]
MRAAVLRSPAPVDTNPLHIEELPMPVPVDNEVLLKVLACGVCHTDLHIVEGELPPRLPWVIPGHQIVAEVIDPRGSSQQKGARVGVSWIGGTDGTCAFCLGGRENLCDHPTYTGYTHQGGYAEYTTARADFLSLLPEGLSNNDAAPLLCAGIIGFRSIRVAEAKRGQRVGLFGFGSSAQLVIEVLRSWDCKVYVSTREPQHQQLARQLGAEWVGGGTDVPPVALDCAVTFAPVGEVVIAALRSLVKGGILAINAIHLDRIPEFDYDSLLWGERQIRSVANMTRQDARDFLKIAADIRLKPSVVTYPLERANEALQIIRHDQFTSPSVIVP